MREIDILELSWYLFLTPSTVGVFSILKLTNLKGPSQLAHMRITFHFIANLHIIKTRSKLFLTEYDKKQHYRMSESTLKNRFFRESLKIKQNTGKIEAEF